MQQEKKFYVYVHRYASGPKQGEIFYVGKGSGRRAWEKGGRNKWWRRIVNKYGFTADIKFSFSNEVCSFSCEKILIGILGRHSLCNLTDGGEGASGAISSQRIKVYSSNGEYFDSMTSAAEFLSINGYDKADVSGISATIDSGCRYCGRLWSKSEIVGENPIVENAKPVECSNGMIFNSVSAAARWVRENISETASQGMISNCATGKNKTAYGLVWRFLGDAKPLDEVSEHKLCKKVKCSNGIVFNSVKDASKWASEVRGKKTSHSLISCAARGKVKKAYGLSWEYVV